MLSAAIVLSIVACVLALLALCVSVAAVFRCAGQDWRYELEKGIRTVTGVKAAPVVITEENEAVKEGRHAPLVFSDDTEAAQEPFNRDALTMACVRELNRRASGGA